MSLVLDASVVVAALVDRGETGAWAEERLLEGERFTAALLPAEVANVLRRAALHGDITPDVAAQAHSDLLRLRMVTVPYGPLGQRVWELRENLACYDAWYVAVAERLGLPLATLDHRLARAPGTRCEFRLPTD